MPAHPPSHRPGHPPSTRRVLAKLPAFALYGEAGPPAALLLHIESIDSRSRLYNWEIDAHVHRGLHQVLWLRSGQVEAVLDETRSQCSGPAALVIPPGVAHAFRFSPGCDGFVLTVNAHLLAEGEAADAGPALHQLFDAPRILSADPESPDVLRQQLLFEALHAESQAADGAGGPVPRWLARAVVWRLAQLGRQAPLASLAGPSSPSGPSGQIGRRMLYTRWVLLLEAHYREQRPVSDYARQLGLSTERLNRMLRTETGNTAQGLLHARLAREACRWLVHVAAPVSRLAYDLGFEDPAYFCRFFKRHTGLSPRAFRQKALLG